MRETVIKGIEENRLIAILRGVDREQLIPLCEALYKGGVRLLEITYTAGGGADAETYESIKMLSEHFSDRLLIGAGTVMTKKQVALTAEAGGKFIISPSTSAAIIKKTRRCGLVSIPGALTPTEIAYAKYLGADFVKLFPITSLGVEYVKAVRAPLSDVKLLAVGGINDKNISDYLRAGVCGFGVGSNITDKKMIKACDYDGIAELAARYVEAVQNG